MLRRVYWPGICTNRDYSRLNSLDPCSRKPAKPQHFPIDNEIQRDRKQIEHHASQLEQGRELFGDKPGGIERHGRCQSLSALHLQGGAVVVGVSRKGRGRWC